MESVSLANKTEVLLRIFLSNNQQYWWFSVWQRTNILPEYLTFPGKKVYFPLHTRGAKKHDMKKTLSLLICCETLLEACGVIVVTIVNQSPSATSHPPTVSR